MQQMTDEGAEETPVVFSSLRRLLVKLFALWDGPDENGHVAFLRAEVAAQPVCVGKESRRRDGQMASNLSSAVASPSMS